MAREGRSPLLVAESLKNKVILTLPRRDGAYRFQRRHRIGGAGARAGAEATGAITWETFTGEGFDSEAPIEGAPLVSAGVFVDHYSLSDGVYTYRALPADHDISALTDPDFLYSNWVRAGECGPIGYSFNNYEPNPGEWGEVICPDDFRYTYLWGTDFRATNGTVFTDEQVRFLVDASVAHMERRLNITIKPVRVRCDAGNRGLKKGADYDSEESFYDYRQEKIARYGAVVLRRRPVSKLHSLSILHRHYGTGASENLAGCTVVDKTKGVLKLLRRPYPLGSEANKNLSLATLPFGSESWAPNVFFAVDYDAGYESASDVPSDLRESIAKHAAVSLLNIIGDGLMSGFSSSSLSMDGMNESFSSTQSATSAYFGARIKVYEDEIDGYVSSVKGKFGYLQMGAL